MHINNSLPIVIVGAGPTGLALAADLGWRNVPTILIDRGGPEVDPAVKIMDIGVRTMEFCRRFNLEDKIHNWGFPLDYPLDNAFVTSLLGHEISRIKMPSLGELGPTEFSPEWQAHCPQTEFDPILRNYVENLPSVQIRYHTELQALSQNDSVVTATVRNPLTDELETIEAAYLVGCDGFHSTVRKLSGIGMTGRGVVDYSLNFMVRSAELNNLGVIGHAKRYVMVGDQGTWATVMAVNGTDYWRLTFYGSNNIDVEQIDVKAAVKKIVGDIEYELSERTPWTRMALTADKFRDGRVFLAGDSAHAVPPNGGFGMNTGFADAMNLGWKLAAVINGHGGERLLQSYENERQPICREVMWEAERNYDRLTADTVVDHITEDSEAGQQAREQMGRQLKENNVKAWKPIGVHLGYQYWNSDVIDYGADERRPFDAVNFSPAVVAGVRAPHVPLEGGRSIIDSFGPSFVLLSTGDNTADTEAIQKAAEEIGLPLRIVENREAAVRKIYGDTLVLVRPDGHVAWHGTTLPEDTRSLVTRVSGL